MIARGAGLIAAENGFHGLSGETVENTWPAHFYRDILNRPDDNDLDEIQSHSSCPTNNRDARPGFASPTCAGIGVSLRRLLLSRGREITRGTPNYRGVPAGRFH
jgi:hypothetical protein